ncbi:MAG: ribonuclease III [Corynebacterium sp.]|nr:ribonuclease III [Corynebacterium sp.]
MNKKGRLTGEAALEEAFAALDKKALCDALGVEIRDDLLRLALTHRSFANENGMLPNNERLEFMGDSVFGLSVATKLFEVHPNIPESGLSKMKAAVVSGFSLAEVARTFDLGSYILLGRGETMSGGANKTSILADTFEALIGAVYIQYGWPTANELVLRHFGDKVRTSTAESLTMDSKTSLQELLASLKLPMASYTAVQEGLVHDPTFTAEVLVNGVKYGQGVGHNKKAAEQKAALEAINRLRAEHGLTEVPAPE